MVSIKSDIKYSAGTYIFKKKYKKPLKIKSPTKMAGLST